MTSGGAAYSLSREDRRQMAGIAERYYMGPSLAKLQAFLEADDSAHPAQSAFNHIHTFIVEGRDGVESILDARVAAGEIRDKKQAAKSIAGSVFQNLIVYVFLLNKQSGAIPANIFVTPKQSAIRRFGEQMTVYVGGEEQKPDCDLVVYNDDNGKFFILSLKTSLRERAGQTYKWKLLLEIASTDNAIREKYDIDYRGGESPLVCFATVNFYNEVNNPQQRGMFKFFDRAFIAKPGVKSEFIGEMSEIVGYIREVLA